MSKSNASPLRKRPINKSTSKKSTPSTSSSTKPSQHGSSSAETQSVSGSRISPLDILRVLTTLLALTFSLSYYLTSGDSLTFNYRPWFTHINQLRAYAVSLAHPSPSIALLPYPSLIPSRFLFSLIIPQRGPLTLTPSQLSLYNGSDPALPIYLAINATVFDVSASPQTYGPGGSYHVFSGRDATRAFVTGCFQQDLTGDLRGVEGMFIPVEDEEDEEGGGMGLSKGQKKIRAEQEKREARKKVAKEVERWVQFYRGSSKYFEVGRVIDVSDGDGSGKEGEGAEAPILCEAAEMARPTRSQLNAEAAAGKGKPLFQPKQDGGKPI
jgi:predicted heme/steroid binding protein